MESLCVTGRSWGNLGDMDVEMKKHNNLYLFRAKISTKYFFFQLK
jgi:hypothetical protein